MKKINDDIIYAFLNCSYKAFLKHHGAIGSKTEHELLECKLLQRDKAMYFDKLRARAHEIQILIEFAPQNNNQCQKLTYVIEPIIQTKQFLLYFDAIEINPMKESSENFVYSPIAISAKEKILPIEKLLLSIKGLLLAAVYDSPPEYGKIIYGRNVRMTKFPLKPHSWKVTKLLKELTTVINNKTPPKFYRNGHCQICEYQGACQALLLKKDDLSLLGRMGQKEVNKLNNKGIFTIHQYSYTYRPKKRKKKLIKPQRVEYPLKALALRENRTYIIEAPTLPNSKTEIYFDLEGLSDENFFYLIGILIIKGKTKNHFSFWANYQNDTEKIVTNFIDKISTLQNFTIYHYGNYEIHALKKLNKTLENRFDKEIAMITKHSINILSLFSSHIYPPTYTNSLKDIAHYIGFEWTDKKASGMQSIVWRKNWELTNETTYKKKLIQYNIDDLEALYSVKKWIANIENNLKKDNEHFIKASDVQSVSYHKWGRSNFQIPELEEINKYAYFDYQRTKIYLRTNSTVKKAIHRARKCNKQINKIDKVLEHLPMKCPSCNYDTFCQISNTKKLIPNLKFMKNGVKRWNLQLPASSYQCSRCGEEFSLQKYGRNLLIWSMNQYITYFTSMPKIEKMLLENFHIYVPHAALYRFKTHLAKEYQSTYEEIKQNLILGYLLHVDETKTAVKGNPNSYVWVFASMDTVYYLFRPNREAGFLKNLLKEFQGVLISDYYSGYSSLSCQQQKCLIHLIRDLNGDLLNNQLNTEYKNIVIQFGNLLRTIIETINTYGLKKRHLHKHKEDVENFYNHIFTEDYDTELAVSWQKRFKKNKGKLFNFLNYDGIPWNNNNAENAIKPVAKYRARIKERLHEEGIKSFLVLLSIQQTCKYRGIKFLDFLKSGEKSLEEFCRNH